MALIESRKEKTSRFFVYTIMTALLLFMLLPLMYLVSQAFKPMEELFIFPPTFYPKRPTLNNFTTLMTALSSYTVPFTRYIFNSVVTTIAPVVTSLFICCLGAYGLSKYRFPGNNFMYNLIVATLMFPAIASGLPNYIIVSSMGLTNTFWALILPKVGSSFSLFLLKQFVDQIPDTYLEAGRLDGASELLLFRKIIIPLLKPAMATAVVFSFMGCWGDSYGPMLYLNEEQLKTLPLIVNTIGGAVSRSGAQAAAGLLMLLPTIVVFAVMQKRVLNTMMYSGVKG